MNQYAAFLKGVNVGGKNRLSMAELREAMERHGFSAPKTYINSGNILFFHNAEKSEVKKELQDMIEQAFGLTIEVVVKTKEEINDTLQGDPFDTTTETEPAKKMVMMLTSKVDPERFASIEADDKIIEKTYERGDLLYIYYRNGAGRSKLTIDYVEKVLGTSCTARNWNTLLKMKEILE